MSEPTDPMPRPDPTTPDAPTSPGATASTHAPADHAVEPPASSASPSASGTSVAAAGGGGGARDGGSGGVAGAGGSGGDDPPEDADDGLTDEERARQRRWIYRKRRARAFATATGKALLIVTLFTIVLFFDRIVHSVYPGEIGVLWSRFFGGTRVDEVYREGMVVTWPWDEFFIYDVREQELNRETVIYARDGLEITVHTSVRYRPQADQIPRLHQEIGPEYVRKIVQPETISTLRRVLGNYTPEMIYAKDEQGLLDELSETLRRELNPDYFEITEFLVLELRLPDAIETAIKDKLTQEQQMLSYRFRLETEKDEKERRIIEAEGLKAFETISGVPILKWRGIEATETLARSPSAKIVLMGTGGDQLPIILNADVPATPAAAAAPAVESGTSTPASGRLSPPPPSTGPRDLPEAQVTPSPGRQLPERPPSRASDAVTPDPATPATPDGAEPATAPTDDAADATGQPGGTAR